MLTELLKALAPYDPQLGPPVQGSDAEIIWFHNGHPGPILQARLERHRAAVVAALGGGRKPRNDGRGTRWPEENSVDEIHG